MILPVEATLPRAQVEPEPKPDTTPEQAPIMEKSPERIGREELYEDIKDAARCSRVYLAMVVLPKAWPGGFFFGLDCVFR